MGELLRDLKDCFDKQEALTSKWHVKEEDLEAEYESIINSPPAGSPLDLAEIAAAQHFMNYSLWHVEDTARRRDVPANVIADCKYKIDVFNQKRNNLIEKIDEVIAYALAPCLPKSTEEKYNTETPGMAVDRMSILALKIFHMREQTLRSDVGREHIDKCAEKLSQLTEQRKWLARSIFDLLDDFLTGRKSIKPYYQHKMYNDKNLNPELYKKS
jgi:hypothetical protein